MAKFSNKPLVHFETEFFVFEIKADAVRVNEMQVYTASCYARNMHGRRYTIKTDTLNTLESARDWCERMYLELEMDILRGLSGSYSPPGRWCTPEECLPDGGVHVLAECFAHDKKKLFVHDIQIAWYDAESGDWHIDGHEDVVVTQWTEIPEPPRKKEGAI